MSWLASALDDVDVKLPWIWDCPLRMTACDVGALSTSPSRTIAKLFCCGVSAVVTASNTLEPESRIAMETTHCDRWLS